MTLDDLGNVGEFIGAMAVVISLLYLAVQIRQNTRSLRASAHQMITVQIAELNRTIVEQPEVASILERGFADGNSLTTEESRRFNAYNSARFRHYDNIYYQYRAGMLEESQWQGLSNLLCVHLTQQPGLRQWWEGVTDFYSTEFVAYCRNMLDQIDAAAAAEEGAALADISSSNDLW